MRILSIQSTEVYDIVSEKGTYVADINKCRESTDYSADIERLGCVPVWGLKQPILDFDTLWDGSLLRRIMSDMSIKSVDELSDKVLFELEVPSELVTIGLSWNSDGCCVIFPSIEKEYVRAVYKVEHTAVKSKQLIYEKNMSIVPI